LASRRSAFSFFSLANWVPAAVEYLNVTLSIYPAFHQPPAKIFMADARSIRNFFCCLPTAVATVESTADSLNSLVYVLRLIMIPSPWVYHALILLSTKLGDVQPKNNYKTLWIPCLREKYWE
jgi:hypothetical protein